MKRFCVSLISSILAFTAGLVTASSWNSGSEKNKGKVVYVAASEPCPPKPPPPVPVNSYTVTPPQQFDFGQNGLRLVPERVQLKGESTGYNIDVSYPQILGPAYTVKPANVQRINQHLHETATKLYQWPLKAAESQRGYYQARSGVRDTVNFTYQVALATDALLSINFIGYSYDSNITRQVQDSFTLNYDLTSGKNLKLSDIFRPGSNYLEFISRYSIDELSKESSAPLVSDALKPSAQNFQSWQITTNGLMFNFHACKVVDCSLGDQVVAIPWADMKPLLNSGIPGKFEITYP